jgi:hypothetical protein
VTGGEDDVAAPAPPDGWGVDVGSVAPGSPPQPTERAEPSIAASNNERISDLL